jgi:zinc transporter 1/2/3
MIGITLGAGSGAGWSTLLIVVVFHQFFEGARIALLCVSNARALIMGLAFAVSNARNSRQAEPN